MISNKVIGLLALLIVAGITGASYALDLELPFVRERGLPHPKPYDYEFLLPEATIYTFEYNKMVDVDITKLDYFVTHEIGVEPVGIGVAVGGVAFGGEAEDRGYIRVTIDMPKMVNEGLLKRVVERVISGEYTLSASEYDRWGIYVKEERKYPIIDAYGLQEFIEERLGINPIGVTTGGVKIIVHMPQPVDRTQLEAIVNEFLQQNGIEWLNPVSKP